MKIELQRGKKIKSSVQGLLKVDGSFECLTLERDTVLIPVGTYRVSLTESASLHRLLPLLHNVPGRTAIRIHSVNKVSELEGCVGVGQTRTSDGEGLAAPARPAEVHLVSLIKAAISQGKVVTISVS